MTQSARAMTVQVVLDGQHGVARLDEPIEDPQQTLHVIRVQAGGRLVAQVERATAAARDERGREREPLPFAAGQRPHRLADAEVAEPDVAEGVERLHQ